MRKSLLFLLIASAFISMPAFAAITVEESTDAEQLINSGYSEAFAEDVFIIKNRALGQPVEPLYEKSQNKFVRGWKKFYAYIDPAQENEDRVHHNIQLSPSTYDL